MKETRSCRPGDILVSEEIGQGVSIKISVARPCLESGRAKLRLEILLSKSTVEFLIDNGGADLGVFGLGMRSLSHQGSSATKLFLTRNIPESLVNLRILAKKEVRKILKLLQRCAVGKEMVNQIYAGYQVEK